MAFRQHSDDLAEIAGPEDELFVTSMDMDRPGTSSSPPRPTKHRRSASFDWGGGAGKQKGDGGWVFSCMLEAKKAMSPEELFRVRLRRPQACQKVTTPLSPHL